VDPRGAGRKGGAARQIEAPVSDATRAMIALIAECATALGTVGAVIVALFLARSQNRARLTLAGDVVVVMEPVAPVSSENRHLRLMVTNSGLREVTITSLNWRVGYFRRAHLYQKLPGNTLSSGLPAKLLPSETASFYFPWEMYLKNAGQMRELFGTRFRRLRARSLRFVVCLSTGEAIRARVSRAVTDQLALAPTPGKPST